MEKVTMVSYNLSGKEDNISLESLANYLRLPLDILENYYDSCSNIEEAIRKTKEIVEKKQNILENIELGGIDLIVDELELNSNNRNAIYESLALSLADILSEEEYDSINSRMQVIKSTAETAKQNIIAMIKNSKEDIKIDNDTLAALIVNLDANSTKKTYNESDMELLHTLFKLNDKNSIIRPYAIISELSKITLNKLEAIRLFSKSNKNGVLTLNREQASLLLDIIRDGIPMRRINRNLLELIHKGNRTYNNVMDDTNINIKI